MMRWCWMLALMLVWCGNHWKHLQAAADGIPFAHLRSCDSLDLVGGRIWSTSCGTLLGTVPVTIVTQCMPPVRLAPFLPLEQKRDTLRHRGDAWVLLRFGQCKCRKQGGIWFFVFISFSRERLSKGFFKKWRSAIHLRMLISSSHLLIFTSSHLLSFFFLLSLSLFSLSLSRSLSLSLALCHGLSLLLFLSSLKAAGSADEAPQHGHLFARNEVRVSKTAVNCDFGTSAATLSHETRFECQKLSFFFASLVGPAATLSHEMRFECRSRCVWKVLCVKVFVCKRIVCKSVCV